MYIPENDYRKQINMSRTQFYYLRKEGRFDNGYHPATRGCRKRLMHRFFNMHSGRIEIPGLNCTESITPIRKPRKSSDKKAQKINPAGTGTTEVPNITIDENFVKGIYEQIEFRPQIERWRSPNPTSWQKVAFMVQKPHQ